jgi:membrane protein involved in colicin uptake
MFNKVQPIAEKLKVYGRGAKSDLDYYKEAAGIYFGELRQEESRLAETERSRRFEVERIEAEKAKVAQVRAHQQKIKTVKQESVKRKAAAPTRAVSGAKKSTNYLDDSDESFEEWYKSVEARM